MIVLDTNVLSEFTRSVPEPRVVSWLDAQLSDDLFITSITVFEMRLGLALLPPSARKQLLEAAVSKQIASFGTRILPFDAEAAAACALLTAHRRALGRPIALQDAQIAAIALTHGMALATRNTQDFDETGIDLLDPWG
ncbi:hypothetical protein LK09_17500 [Microbacterium mangrovi]|uniref:Ribonuclease VapC n=1 Tax=Microbacterium mangrovi TaxID=1348253 RepID=A0A0B1ZYL2_9MICO|nr:type II toxin-antitoxin system VapC family toxin [Microbacterium mangrovi]KHK95826.1 hypothetical protein LK09_17500 [Microbacterium mangrovi]